MSIQRWPLTTGGQPAERLAPAGGRLTTEPPAPDTIVNRWPT